MVDETVFCQGFVPICHSTHESEFTAVICVIVKGVKKGGLGGEEQGKERLMRDRSDGRRMEESDLHDLHLLYV